MAFSALVIPAIIMLGDPHIDGSQSLCPFKMLTGFPCPGCGITKSIISFYQGDILKSLSYHLFGPLVIVFCLATIITLSVELFTNKKYFRKYLFNMKIGYAMGGLLAIYHLTRLVVFVVNNNLSEILRESIWK